MPKLKVQPLLNRPLPEVHRRLEHLRVLTRRYLVAMVARSPLEGRVHRATANAILAMEQAAAGHRESHHLRVAHSAMVLCAGSFRLLCVDRQVSVRTYVDVKRHIEQIMCALEQLSVLPSEKWARQALPPLAPFESARENEVVAQLQTTWDAVEEHLRSMKDLDGGLQPQIPNDEGSAPGH